MNKWLIFIGAIHIYSSLQRTKESPNIYYVDKIPFGYNGLMLPPFGVFIKKEYKNTKHLLLHELVHWEQYRREGLLAYLVNYATEQIKNGYDHNCYEVEARFEESDFCKSNYTYCVRNGLAKTVHNPYFRT